MALNKGLEMHRKRVNSQRTVLLHEPHALLLGRVDLAGWVGSGTTKTGEDFREEARKLGTANPQVDRQA